MVEQMGADSGSCFMTLTLDLCGITTTLAGFGVARRFAAIMMSSP